MISKLPAYWFNKIGDVQRRNETTTDGSVSVAYDDYISDLAMRLVSVKGGENGNQERLNTQNPFQIYLSGAPDVTATDRIVYSDRIFDILSVNNPDENATYTRCDCEEVLPAPVAGMWPFDTDFDFPVGPLTGNDGWTTSGTANSTLVTTTGLRSADTLTTAQNVRTLPSGAPLSNGPFYLGIGTNGFGGASDQTLEVSVYASSVLKISITLHFNSGTGDLEYGITTPASPIPLTGSISGYVTGDDLFVLSQTFGSLVLFYNNNGPIASLVTFSVGLTTLNSVSIGITDASIGQTARITQIYFGDTAP